VLVLSLVITIPAFIGMLQYSGSLGPAGLRDSGTSHFALIFYDFHMDQKQFILQS
jgi:hypothetical protein